jgi:putative chitinase
MATFSFTLEQLKRILNNNKYSEAWYNALIKILPEYNITTKLRVAAFLAQTGHESLNYTVLKENLNYSVLGLRKVFPKYFPTDAIAKEYARNPERIANRVYANRMGNGDENSGDGYRYRGRGLIQLTGKENYQKFAASINVTDVSDLQDYLITYEGAVQSAAWFWETHSLNTLADQGNFVLISKRINGGLIGIELRTANYNRVLGILH